MYQWGVFILLKKLIFILWKEKNIMRKLLLFTMLLSLVAVIGGCGNKESATKEVENYRSDEELCNSVCLALTFALSDPETIDWSGYSTTIKAWSQQTEISSLDKNNKIAEYVLEQLEAEDGLEIKNRLKSEGAEDIYFQVTDGFNTVSVWIPGTDIYSGK